MTQSLSSTFCRILHYAFITIIILAWTNVFASETLDVQLLGNGAGTITSTPAGINCGSSCSADFSQNSVITLTATPHSESQFTGWSGGTCTGLGECTITLEHSQSVTAVFSSTTPSAPLLLVDFGDSELNNLYNVTMFPGWNTVTSAEAGYSANGPAGLASTGGDLLANYQKITGDGIDFSAGDVIDVGWFNDTGAMVSRWRPLISFTDGDNPVNLDNEPQWYAMEENSRLPEINYMSDQTTRTSRYIITSQTQAPGDSPPTEGVHGLINISVNHTAAGIICNKIELRRAADHTPSPPLQLIASQTPTHPDSRVILSWQAPVYGIVEHYRIYRDGLWVGKTSETTFTDANLEYNTSYLYSVRAFFNKHAPGPLSNTVNARTAGFQGDDHLIDPQKDVTYLGAFRFPDYSQGAGYTWNYRSGGLTYFPAGDPESVDGDSDFPGALYAYGHTYGHRIAAISIPRPVLADTYEALPRAQMLVASFQSVMPANKEGSDYGHPGVAYLGLTNTFYTSFGHYYNQSGSKWVTHGAFDPDYSNIQGLWYVGDKNSNIPNYYAYNKYMSDISTTWANTNTPGMYILTGGNHVGADPMGPGLVAIRPWNENGTSPPPDAELDYTILLEYDTLGGEHSLAGWIQEDWWMGVSWLSRNGKSAVAISGTKAYGEYYYGYEDGSTNAELINNVPRSHNTDPHDKGGQARRFRGMLLFFNPNDLALVAKSQRGIYQPGDSQYRTPGEVQPYAMLDIDHYLLKENFNNEMSNDRIGGMTFDQKHGLLYVVECKAWQEMQDVIHVFKLEVSRASSILDFIPAMIHSPKKDE